MQIPRLLVLGATGRIGRILRMCWPDLSRDLQVTWQARAGADAADSALNWAVFDPLSDSAALARASEGCDGILCLSGVIPGRGGDLDDNIVLAEAAVWAGAASGARVLLASSAAVYGNQPGAVSETAPLCPTHPYGVAKARMEERAAQLAATEGSAVCALRIGNIAGLDAILGGWRPGFRLDRFADGRTPRRSYIGGRSLARVLAAVTAAPDLPAALNIAAPGLIEMGALLTAAGRDWTPQPAPQSAIAEVHLDTAALQRIHALPAADAGQMVAEWAELEPHMSEGARA